MAEKFTGEPLHEQYLKQEPTSFRFKHTTIHEIHSIIKNMHNKTSHGHDLLTNKILKTCSDTLSIPLHYIINLSKQQNTFPHAWKTSRVIPLYKKDDKLNITNYRPISLCPVGSKVLKKVINKQVLTYLTTNNILPHSQFGFRPKNRTSHLLLQFINTIEKAIAQKKKIIVSYLDFSKAFDSIPHSLFLSKLPYLGFLPSVCEWFDSYLKNRSQYTDFMGVFSSLEKVICGVPQGTCLGPLIFLMHTIDIKHHLRHSHMFSFADDTTILTIADTFDDAAQKAATDYAILTEWYYHSRLSLNIGKTKYMLFGAADNATINLKMQNTDLERVKEYKLVGLTIDENLKWKSQCQNTAQKLRLTYVMLARNKNILPEKTKILIYHSLFHSHLIYGSEFYGAATKSCLKQLKSLQEKTLKLITKTDIKAFCKKQKILTVEDTIIKQRIMLAHSILSIDSPTNIKLILQRSPTTMATRSQNKKQIQICKPSTERQRRSAYYSIPLLWNNLHSSAQNATKRPLSTMVSNQLLQLY